MNFLYYEVSLGSKDAVQVVLDKQANVRLLDSSNFASYKSGKSHNYYGGLAKSSPVTIPAPHAGKWYVVIDLGGFAGTVKASVTVIKR